jgi:hypothetical protein
MKELGVLLDFTAKRITFDEIILPVQNIYLRQGASMLLAHQLNIRVAMLKGVWTPY